MRYSRRDTLNFLSASIASGAVCGQAKAFALVQGMQPASKDRRDLPSLKDFGPAGNGADDTAVIAAAVAALNAGDIADLYIPAGSYRISRPLPAITADGATIRGAGKRRSVIKPSGSFDCLWFKNANPLRSRISDITLEGFGIDYGLVTAPTAGIALRLSRADRISVDIDIRSAFRCVLVEGGADQHWGMTTFTNAFSWAAKAIGSYTVKFTNYPGTIETPSEIYFANINWKGATTSGENHLENCVIVECCDGIQAAAGHIGFAHDSLLLLSAQADTRLSILDFDFGRIYLDGNNAGSSSGAALRITGSSLPLVSGIKLSGGKIRNFAGKGVWSDLPQLRDLDLDSMQFSDLGKEHVDIRGGSDRCLDGSSFRYGNKGKVGASAIKLTKVAYVTAIGVQVHPGVNAHPRDFDLSLVINGSFMGCHTTGTLDYSVNNGCDRLRFAGNTRAGGPPSVVATDGFALPFGFPELVVLTGNRNMSNISATNIAGYTQVFGFTGTASFNDAAGNVHLHGTGGFAATPSSRLTLQNDGANWVETGRAVI